MSNSYRDVVDVIEQMRQSDVEPNESVREALQAIRAPYYKVAFVGKFQVGKTHIINKVFLNNENLLAEGVGLCKTAVTVEINHGEQKQFTYCSGEQTQVVINPDNEVVGKVTAATDEDERLDRFSSIEDAVLQYPNELLRNISVYDTPGIDDPNEELLRETTYKLLPSLDMAVMVVAPRALSQVELRFLQKKVFSCGISNFMIVVSCKPMDNCDEDDELLLRRQIQNQLRSIGREALPLYFYRENEDGLPLIDLANVIAENAMRFTLETRTAKLRKALSDQLSDEIAKLTIASTVYGKDHAELLRMKNEAIQALSSLRQAMEDLQNEFTIRLTQHGMFCVRGFESDIREAQDEFICRLDDVEYLGEAQEILNHADEELQQMLEDVIVTRMQSFYDFADRLVNDLKGELKTRWQEKLCPAMFRTVDGGRVQNWNSTWITFADYLVTTTILPGGILLAIGLRWILGKVPIVRRLLPANILKDHMVSVAKESLDEQLPLLVAEFDEHIANEQQKIYNFLATVNQTEIDRQQHFLNTIMEKEEASSSAFDAVGVRAKISALSDLLVRLV